jgi:hypothetical protein
MIFEEFQLGHLINSPKIHLQTDEQRVTVFALIRKLGEALDLEPGAPITALTAAASKLDVIKTSDDRQVVGDLRKRIVEAKKQVAECCDDACKRWHDLHKIATKRKADYLAPLDTALATVNSIIEMDMEEQQSIAAEEQARLQAEADAKARAEQAEREKVLRAEALKLKAEREQARQEALKAAQAAETEAEAERIKAQARAEESRMREEETRAKQALEEAKRAPVIAAPVEEKTVERVAGVRYGKPVYKGRVFDINMVPEAYLMPREANQRMIDAACKATGLETRIPGVQVYDVGRTVATK